MSISLLLGAKLTPPPPQFFKSKNDCIPIFSNRKCGFYSRAGSIYLLLLLKSILSVFPSFPSHENNTLRNQLDTHDDTLTVSEQLSQVANTLFSSTSTLFLQLKQHNIFVAF